MKKLLLALICVTFVAVTVSGCCGNCPFKKKETTTTETAPAN